MKAKPPTEKDLAALDARADQMAVVNRRCASCAEPYRSLIRHWLKRMAAHPGRPGIKHLELHAHLRDLHGFRLSASAIQQHLAEHEPELYKAAKSR